ncbi:MAG: hypothetical protein ABI867_17590 [Kofleriaceae bacterium]
MSFDAAAGVCVCADNAIADGGGCLPCAADEIKSGDTCGCPAGAAKNADGVCAMVPGLGAACDDATPCTSEFYGLCQAGACTKACAIDTDCPDTYTCADWEPEPYCRTFTGFGATCSTSEACAGFDADFCAQGSCVVDGCTVGVDDCPRDTACCDFSSFGIGTVCAPAELCP